MESRYLGALRKLQENNALDSEQRAAIKKLIEEALQASQKDVIKIDTVRYTQTHEALFVLLFTHATEFCVSDHYYHNHDHYGNAIMQYGYFCLSMLLCSFEFP